MERLEIAENLLIYLVLIISVTSDIVKLEEKICIFIILEKNRVLITKRYVIES
jgi:hypothetical protein